MNLTQCPYDGAELDAEVSSRGSLLIACPACDAVWETHGAWVGRLREPDREKMLEERRRADVAAQAVARRAPSSTTPAEFDRQDAPRS